MWPILTSASCTNYANLCELLQSFCVRIVRISVTACRVLGCDEALGAEGAKMNASLLCPTSPVRPSIVRPQPVVIATGGRETKLCELACYWWRWVMRRSTFDRIASLWGRPLSLSSLWLEHVEQCLIAFVVFIIFLAVLSVVLTCARRRNNSTAIRFLSRCKNTSPKGVLLVLRPIEGKDLLSLCLVNQSARDWCKNEANRKKSFVRCLLSFAYPRFSSSLIAGVEMGLESNMTPKPGR